MAKKSQTITDERPREAEITALVEEQPQPLSEEQRYLNACDEVARLDEALVDKQPFIKDRMMQIALVQQTHTAAQVSLDEALKDERESQERIDRQHRMVKIGGQAEEVILQGMLAEHERLGRNVEFARQNLEEAGKLNETIPAIVESLEQLQSECEQLEQEKREMESIRDELHRAYGLSRFNALRSQIIEAKEDHVRARVAEKGADLRAHQLQMSIRESLADWKDLAQQLFDEYGIKKEEISNPSPKLKVLESHLSHLQALIENGPAIELNDAERRHFSAQLDLNPSMIRAFLEGDRVTAEQRLYLTKQLLEQEKRKHIKDW